jgi:hypothetical protein
MHIVQSDIQFSARREYSEVYSRQESLQMVSREGGQAEEASQGKKLGHVRDMVNISPQGKSKALAVGKASGEQGREISPKLAALIEFIEQATGKKVKLMHPGSFQGAKADAAPQVTKPSQAEAQEQMAKAEPGFSYELQEYYQETERTQVQAKGVFATADGREVSFDFQVSMSRTFMSAFNLQIQSGSRIDPLVVNYPGTAAQVSQDSFEFDLDMDGQLEKMAFPEQGSGFLALDKDGNGEINDGSELFGPQSADGFGELAAYDQDGNGWIDEGDAVFGDLQVWSKGPDGQNRLLGLGKLGIGALYLGSIESEFMVKDSGNEDLAQVKRSGMYVTEDGNVGSLQEMNFVGR